MFPVRFVEVLAQVPEANPAPEGNPGAGGGSLGQLLFPMAIVFFIFWLLVFRPESKKRKERQRMIAAVKKGDVVMTTGGLIGKVWKVDETEVVIQIDKDKDIKGRFAKSAVFEVIDAGEGSAKRPSEDAVRALEERAKSS